MLEREAKWPKESLELLLKVSKIEPITEKEMNEIFYKEVEKEALKIIGEINAR